MEAVLGLQARGAYEAPAVTWTEETGGVVAWLWWAVVVGFTFSVALAYAAYCTSRGGNPDISFGWSGFKVSCYR